MGAAVKFLVKLKAFKRAFLSTMTMHEERDEVCPGSSRKTPLSGLRGWSNEHLDPKDIPRKCQERCT